MFFKKTPPRSLPTRRKRRIFVALAETPFAGTAPFLGLPGASKGGF
jgi:hypothetical protein